MVYLPVSHLSRAEALGGGRLSGFSRRTVMLFEIFAAAVRVASAVEARRDPNPADLERLGISGKLPKVW